MTCKEIINARIERASFNGFSKVGYSTKYMNDERINELINHYLHQGFHITMLNNRCYMVISW